MARGLTATLFVFSLWTAALAEAQDPSDEASEAPADAPDEPSGLELAREHFQQGVELTQQDRWGEALVFFQRSLSIAVRPNTLFNIAGILVRLGRGREAVEHYERYLEIAPSDDPDRPAALRALEAARSALARLRLLVWPPDTTLRVDGLRVERPDPEADGPIELVLDPGSHVIDVHARGHHREVFRVSLLPGVRGERSIRLVPLEGEGGTGAAGGESASAMQIDETSAHVLLVAGPITLAVGGVFFGMGIQQRGVVENAAPGVIWADIEGAYDNALWGLPLGVALLALGASITAAGAGWLGGMHLSVEIDTSAARLWARGRF